MLTVTDTAREKLRGKLQGRKGRPGECVRLVSAPSPANPTQMKMVVGTQDPEDLVVVSEDGVTLLLVGADLLPTLEGMVIDFRETSRGTGFTLSKDRVAK